MRIVSLIPAATEWVACLGLQDQLVGVTHECDHPPLALRRPKVTRSKIPADADSAAIDQLVAAQASRSTTLPLYELDQPALRKLQPDLILTQELCDVCAVDAAVVRRAARACTASTQVLNLAARRFAEVLAHPLLIANAAGVPDRGTTLRAELQLRIDRVHSAAHRPHVRPPRLVVLEWIDPIFSSGHWTPELVSLAGATEPLADAGDKSRRLTPADLLEAAPEILVIAACGLDVDRARRDLPALATIAGLEDLPAVRNDRVFLADGSAYFNRPGPRLVDTLELLSVIVRDEIDALSDDVVPPERVRLR